MGRLGAWVLSFVASCSSGCAALNQAGTPRPEEASSISGNAALAGDAGVELDVLTTIRTVKGIGSRRLLGSRAVRLPTREHYEIAVFDYELPEACGGYRFRVYETGDTQILEYAYEQGSAGEYLIRDYVAGSSPFIKPGLWSSYDHTADSVSHMMTLFGETDNPLMPSVYSRGVVTGLAEMTQRELDSAYREAVKAATQCARS